MARAAEGPLSAVDGLDGMEGSDSAPVAPGTSPVPASGGLRVERPRVFHLQRLEDVSGVSGTGRVADGVLWPDGSVAVRWRGPYASTVTWSGLADVVAVHGHDGATRVVFDDVETGQMSINEQRELLGLRPFTFPEAAIPVANLGLGTREAL